MSQPTLEDLPVKLQLAILGSISGHDGLTFLSFASPLYEEAYLRHKKLTIPQATRVALGDMFVDACMLYHWKHNINSYTEVEDDGTSSHQATEIEAKADAEAAVDTQPWPQGPYRHIQLKFLYDYDMLTVASPEDQVKYMQALLTAEDFSRILSFHYQDVRPLSILAAYSLPIMRYDVSDRRTWDGIFEGECRHIRNGQCRWIMRTLYRVQILYRMYGTTRTTENERNIDPKERHLEAVTNDFLGRFDAADRMEFQVVHTAVLSYLRKYFDIIGKRLAHVTTIEWQRREHVMATDFFNAPTLGAAVKMMRSGPLHLSKFVWETLMGTKEAHHFSIKWPEGEWTGSFQTKYNVALADAFGELERLWSDTSDGEVF